jgi:Phage capsid family
MTWDRTRLLGDGRSEREAGLQDEAGRPYPSRPYPSRPYPSRPYPSRPYPSRPYPSRPYPSRPYPSRGEDGEPPESGGPYPQEWSSDVAELFCARSALVRLGAQLVFGDCDLDVPGVMPGVPPRYLAQPQPTPSPNLPAPMTSRPKPSAPVSTRRLQPSEHELAWELVVPNRLARDLAEHPDLGWALKRDLAEGLARTADAAFLNGAPAGPLGVANIVAAAGAPAPPPAAVAPNLLWRLRTLVETLRRRTGVIFGSAGWIIHPATLADLTFLTTSDYRVAERPTPAAPPPPAPPRGATLDANRLLTHDGRDGGTLLGYPFIISEAVGGLPGARNIFFSSDWSEAWIGVERDLVTIELSTEARFSSDDTVIRAVMHHDLVLRRRDFFIHAPQ